MSRDEVIAVLRSHEDELRAAGVLSVSLFGSMARGEMFPQDVDLAVRLGVGFSRPGFEYFSRLDELEERFRNLLGHEVDVIEEPAERERLQKEIDKDRAIAF
jgi:uncharacterized protein